jgi:hypothetical protein
LSSLENIQTDAFWGTALKDVFLETETKNSSKRKEPYEDYLFRDVKLRSPVHYLLALRRNLLLPSSG